MPRIILLLIILLVLVYFIYRFRRLSPEQKQKAIKIILLTLAGGVLMFMVLSGRLNWLIAAIGALIPLIPRVVRFVVGYAPALLPFLRRYQQNRHSSMHTRYIRMQMNILTGELQGEILEGAFAGQKLQALTREQLLQLLDECKQNDAQSAALLMAYLNRMHPDWSEGENHDHGYTPSDSDMSEQQARDILGVSEKATKEEINTAHKRLMQKMHPDRGGSDYLAQQINRARDKLLKSL